MDDTGLEDTAHAEQLLLMQNTLPEGVPTARIGRYVLLRRLGIGGMGAVYAAYDPKLNRRVALKLVRPDLVISETVRRRFLREARALARLSHANVVQVHDVEVVGDDIYVVMEFIQGVSLREFCKRAPRPDWKRVLRAYIDAARGLAAAHDKGLVHRDFKPANVLMDYDGSAKVVDFGLAAGEWSSAEPDTVNMSLDPAAMDREADARVRESDRLLAKRLARRAAHVGRRSGDRPESTAALGGDTLAGAATPLDGYDTAAADTFASAFADDTALDAGLTVSGVVMGTPAYMAPEQHEGKDIGPAADIYGFCASLYEALYGQTPFPLDGLGWYETGQLELLRRKLDREIVQPSAAAAALVPDWLRCIVLRGLEPEPGDRWPSMHELIKALQDDPAERRRERMRMIGLLAVLAALTGFAVFGWLRHDPQPSVCANADQELAGLWDAEISNEVRARFQESGSVHADATHTRLVEILDSYAGSWVAMKNDTCAATHVRKEQSQRLLDLRMQCLARLESRLRALTHVLVSKPDRDVINNSVPAALALPPVLSCADTLALSAAYPPPEDATERARVFKLEQQLDLSETLEHAGRYQVGLNEAEAVLRDARSLDHPPLRARALFAVARLCSELDNTARAEALVREALPVAARANDDALTARLWIFLIDVVGLGRARPVEAMNWRLAAETAVARAAGTDGSLIRGTLFSSLGRLLDQQGDYQAALDMQQRALELREAVLGDDHLATGAAHNEVGNVYYSMGRYAEAGAAYQRALEIRERVLGDQHPLVANALNNLGIAAMDLGEFERARQFHERALRIRRALFGDDSPSIASSLNNLGLVLQRMGDYQGSRELHAHALTIRERALAPDHPLAASALIKLGYALFSMGDYQRAEAVYQRTEAIHQARNLGDHRDPALVLEHQAELAFERGDVAAARASYQRALDMLERAFAVGHPHTIRALTGLGRCATRSGRRDDALDYLQRAYDIQERTWGKNHPDVIPILMAMGELFDSDSGNDHDRRAVDYWERALGVAMARKSGLLADAQFGLARALRAMPAEHSRARELAETAAAFYGRVGHEDKVARVAGWLALNPGEPRGE